MISNKHYFIVVHDKFLFRHDEENLIAKNIIERNYDDD